MANNIEVIDKNKWVVLKKATLIQEGTQENIDRNFSNLSRFEKILCIKYGERLLAKEIYHNIEFRKATDTRYEHLLDMESSEIKNTTPTELEQSELALHYAINERFNKPDTQKALREYEEELRTFYGNAIIDQIMLNF